jgi:Domain of unknown function (DUF4815)
MASTANNANLISSLTTDFNVTPYYDDFNSGEKDFYRILFKPGYAVQARELTQIQSMTQSQLFRFGKHVFKEGSIVIPGQYHFKMNIGGTKGLNLSYVKIKNTDGAGNTINVNDFLGQTLTGQTSTLQAVPEVVLDTDGTTSNTKTFYFSSYSNASQADPTIRVFQNGETLTSNVGSCVVVDSGATGYGSWFEIEEGVVFAKDHFISFSTQSTILERYNPNPSCKVGFYITEDIINASQDTSLLDPALEASNYAAPGADRLKLTATLSVRPYDDTEGAPNFVTLFTVKNGVVQISNEKTQYNILGDTLAERTFQESGDYIVKGFNVTIQEHDRITGSIPNYGRYDSGNNQLLVVGVDPGNGYAKGYPVVNNDRYEIELAKPLDYINVSQQFASTTQGQYVFANEFVGTWELDKGNRINLWDTVQRRVTNSGNTIGGKWSTGSQTGAQIGSAIVNSIQYYSGTPGYDATYQVFLSDIKMTGSNTFSNVRSLFYDVASVSDPGADVVGANGNTTNTVLQAVNQSTLLYYTGANYVKTVRDPYGAGKGIYYFNETQGVSAALSFGTGGTLTVSSLLGGATNESLPYTVSQPISSTDVAQDFVCAINSSFNIGPLWSSSTVSSLYGNNRVDGVGTYFNYLNVGSKVEFESHANTYYVTSIISNTIMLLSNTAPATVSGKKIFKAYKNGDILNLTGKGVTAGGTRTVTMGASNTSFTIDLKETLPSSVGATVTYKVGKRNALEATKTLNPGRYVKINCATAGTTGPFCLGFSDIYQVTNVTLKTGSAPSSTSDGTDVTDNFILDNGQKDDHYELASIRKNGITLGATDYLLVKLDYFTPTYTGRSAFFTIDSYPIQDDDALATSSTIRTENIPIFVSPTSGLKYDLRNQLDFRPIKSITATDTTSVGSATTNPSNNSTSYVYAGSGLKFPVPSTDLIFDYSYYIGRKDVVTVNKDGYISISKGIPSSNPVAPDVLDTQMLLSILDIAPYPSLSPAYGNVLKRRDLSCGARKVSNRGYTMRDIGILEKRIQNLEYYTTLTLLEKDALNFKILDANGLDRFKNGYFIDTFKDASLSAKGTDPDFRIKFDATELSIRPLFTVESFGYESISSVGAVVNAGKITFDYTDELFFAQPRVTDTRLLERGTYYYQGKITLTPETDVWIDTTFAADETVSIQTDNSLIAIQTSNEPDVAASFKKSLDYTDWEAWKATVTGYNLYRGSGAAKTFVGRYDTEAQARAVASQWTTAYAGGEATLETIYNNTRSGTDWFSNFSADTAAGGNKLISSDVIPYIRPQEIVIKVQGLKAYSKMHVFFDGVNVTNYCVPLTETQYPLALGKVPMPLNTVAGWSDDLIVGNSGNLYFIFKITKDGPKFKTGERKMVVTDSEQISPQTLDATVDASTVASAYFFADGTKQTLQRTVYSTSGYKKTTGANSQSYISQADAVLPNTWRPPPKAGHCCFDPDAKVLMADLTWKAIKDVAEGDEVLGDDGEINKVVRNNKVNVGDRKMMQFKGKSFYTTDDHLFLTEKGWKTWDPNHVMHDPKTRNKEFLVGDNQFKSIDKDDTVKVYDLVDGNLSYQFVPYADIEPVAHDFDPNYEVHDLTLEGNLTYIVEGFVAHNCCVAYTVLIKAPQDEEGIFVTSFDIFVARKSQTRPLWFELREMDSSGQVTDTVIPGTVVNVDNADIPVSVNGYTDPLNVRFSAPVFLFNNKPYGFVVHSLAAGLATIDPDTQIWISRLGQTDKQTGAQVTERMKMGTFFQTTNNRQWEPVVDIDLTMNVYRAKFNTGTATSIIGQQPIEKMILANVSSSLSSRLGDHFVTGDTLSLSSVTVSGSNVVSIGDRVIGNVSLSAASGNVVYSLGSNRYSVSNTRYQLGERVSMYLANGYYKGITGIVTGIANSSAQLNYYDESSANIYAEFITSTGNFIEGQTIQSTRESGYSYKADIKSLKDFRYSSVSFEPMALDFVKTALKYDMQTYANGSTTASGYETIIPSDTHYFNEEKILYAKTNELSKISSDHSNKIKVTLESTSEYVSPLLDLNSTHTLFIDNLINSNTYNETAASGGYALNKYISQTVTLADGQDAEDIQVIISGYRPPTTDIKIYAKILNASDPTPLAQLNWIELSKKNDGDTLYSSLANRTDFKEFTYGFATSQMTGAAGQVQYTSNGTTYTGYKYFAIKIVLTSDTDRTTGIVNTAVVPRVADLRCIALQI